MADDKEIALFHSVLLHPSVFVNAWMIYLVDPKFDGEDRLRFQIFLILITGMIDVIRNSQREDVLEKLLNYNDSGKYYFELSNILRFEILNILKLFSKKELLYFQELRNQRVHGSLNGFSKEMRRYFYIQGDQVVHGELNYIDYYRIFKEVDDLNTSMDDYTYWNKFRDYESPLWPLLSILKESKITKGILDDLRSNTITAICLCPNTLDEWKKSDIKVKWSFSEIRRRVLVSNCDESWSFKVRLEKKIYDILYGFLDKIHKEKVLLK